MSAEDGQQGAELSRFKIYTKTGDSGTSSLYDGTRLPKDSDFFKALGDVDEVNCVLGLAREFQTQECQPVGEQLEVIQSRLFDVGSAVATPTSSASQAKVQHTRFDAAHTALLEAWIDELDKQLPVLRNFILPSGGSMSAFLHQARAICRRAERSVIPLTRDANVDPQVAIYLNRLSDYLFTAARFVAKAQTGRETVYKKGA